MTGMNSTIELGATYVDVVTGFRGVATGRVEYISGSRQVLLAPPAVNGEMKAAEWLDDARLRSDGGDILKLAGSAEVSGLILPPEAGEAAHYHEAAIRQDALAKAGEGFDPAGRRYVETSAGRNKIMADAKDMSAQQPTA